MPEIASKYVTLDRDLYLTEDRSRVVLGNDTAAHWLWASAGQIMPRAEAEKLGALDLMDG